ncbi:hypothetical protein LR013_04610 [candidate division NPL-UPA2 bacterium]|nr:hypothetical protein [candidate division NPL-UPA2 bacterium]
MPAETIALMFSVGISGVAIIGLLVALFYFIFSESRRTRDEVAHISNRLATLEGRYQEWAPHMQAVADLLLKKSSNPDGEREQLLKRWKAGTLNYGESLRLRDILATEAEQAEEARKNIIALGLLALFIYALTKK